MNLRRAITLIAALLCFVGLSLLVVDGARAQNLYASIRGTVTDPSGGVLPDVNVTARNLATGVGQTVASSKDGSYVFLQLAIGDYEVKAEKSGFKASTTTRIHLDVNQVYELNVKMEIGAMAQQVTVEASQTQVETTTPQLGAVVDANQIVDMPLIGRNFVNLEQLLPGVVTGSDRFGTFGSGGNTDYATNGGQSQFNVFLIDGTDTNDLVLNTTTFIPSPDSIQEFRLVTGTMNAEYARSSGAIMNAVMKSGTNSFHGDAFNFYRDTFLNAADYTTRTRQQFHRNEFGGTIGGPAIKNHTFFFFSYQGARAREPQPGEETQNPIVFSGAQQAGDFSADNFNGTPAAGGNPTVNPKQSPFPLFGDASSPCPASGGVQCPAGTFYGRAYDANGVLLTNGLFSTGMVPTQDFSAFSTAIANKYIPAANNTQSTPCTPSPTDALCNQFAWNSTRLDTDDQYLVRIDQTFNAKDSLWGTWFIETFPRSLQVPFVGATVPGFGETDKEHFKFLSLAWTHVINDHMVNELRGGYNRFNFDAVEPTTPMLPSAAGFGITPQDVAGAAFPVIDVGSGYFHLGFSEDGPQPRIDQVYEGVDNFSVSEGRHTLKFGFDMRRWQVFNPFLSTNDGLIVFRTYGTYSTGDPGLDFLLGIPTRYIQGSGSLEDSRAQQYYSYAQDEFKLRANLTLTFGLGWTIDTPMLNQAFGGHGQVAFRPGQQSVIFPNAPLGVVYQGDPGVHTAGSTKPWRQWGPRFGFAYSPNVGPEWLTGGPGKLSIRGGVGIYYDRSETEQADQVVGMPPFAISTQLGVQAPGTPALQINPSFATPFTDIATGATVGNPYPFAGPTSNIAFTAADGNLPVYSFCCAGLDANSRDPLVENYSLTVERQLSNSTVLSVGYVGSSGHHLTVGFPQNLPTGLDGSGNVLFKYDPATYGSIDTLFSGANSNYNSLQVSVNKHMSRNLQFLASYTYAHSLDEASGFENSAFGTFGISAGGFASVRAANPFCFPGCSYASSIYDSRQRFVISYIYQIPGMHGSALLSRATQGWTLTGITTFQSGFPLDVIDSASPSGGCFGGGDFSCWEGPDQVSAVKYLNPRTTGRWFDGSAFAPVACEAAGCPASGVLPMSPLAYGNAPRNVLHGPGLNNWDFTLYKDTQINERMKLEIRLESYNTFNHTQFDPNGVITDVQASNFGAATTTLSPRRVQLAAKFYF